MFPCQNSFYLKIRLPKFSTIHDLWIDAQIYYLFSYLFGYWFEVFVVKLFPFRIVGEDELVAVDQGGHDVDHAVEVVLLGHRARALRPEKKINFFLSLFLCFFVSLFLCFSIGLPISTILSWMNKLLLPKEGRSEDYCDVVRSHLRRFAVLRQLVQELKFLSVRIGKLKLKSCTI